VVNINSPRTYFRLSALSVIQLTAITNALRHNSDSGRGNSDKVGTADARRAEGEKSGRGLASSPLMWGSGMLALENF